MSTTLSPSEPLEAVLRARWEAGNRRIESDHGDAVKDLAIVITDAMVGCGPEDGGYWQWETDEDERTIAGDWLEYLYQEAEDALRAALASHVIPSVAQTITAELPNVPERLRTFPGSTTLRADLARLEAQS